MRQKLRHAWLLHHCSFTQEMHTEHFVYKELVWMRLMGKLVLREWFPYSCLDHWKQRVALLLVPWYLPRTAICHHSSRALWREEQPFSVLVTSVELSGADEMQPFNVSGWFALVWVFKAMNFQESLKYLSGQNKIGRMAQYSSPAGFVCHSYSSSVTVHPWNLSQKVHL